MANALLQPYPAQLGPSQGTGLSAGGFDPANPKGWHNARGVDIMDLRAMRPMLVAQGQWDPAWDAALDDSAYYSPTGNAEVGNEGLPAPKSLDLNALSGYKMAEQRGDGRTGTAAYFDPNGGMGPGWNYQRGGAMHSGDWKQAIGTVGGVLAAGYGIQGALGAAGGAGGAAGGAGGAAAGAGGMTAAEQIAFLAANGMSDAAIAAAYPGLASAGGLTGVGGGLAAGAAGAEAWDVPMSELSQPSTDFGVQNVGAQADMATPGGYGAGMSGAETGAYDAALKGGGSALGSGLTDFFTGNGNLSDYGRVAQGLIGLYGQNRATNAAQAGQESQNALMREMMAKNQPLIDTRDKALGGINALMADPSGVTKDPGYQFGLQQGQSQIDNQAAARGGYYSGQQLKASQQFGQDYAGTKLDQSLNRLLGVAGMGQIGSNQNNGLSINLGQGMANQGNIRAGGYMGMANTAGSTVGDWTNDWINRKTWGG